MAQNLPNGYVGEIPVGADDWGGDVNDNMRRWAVLTQLSVISMTAQAPPAPKVVNDVYIVPTNPTGEWAQFANQIVFWNGTAFVRYLPSQGLLAYDRQRNAYYKYEGNAWIPLIPALVGCAYYLPTDFNPPGNLSRVPFSGAGRIFDQNVGGNLYNTATNEVNIPATGFYDINFKVSQTAANGAGLQAHERLIAQLLLNNGVVAEDYTRALNNQVSTLASVQISGLFVLGINDKIAFSVVDTPNNLIVAGGHTKTLFSIRKVE